MVKKMFLGILVSLFVFPAFAQENRVKRLPEIAQPTSEDYHVYREKNTGFFAAAELVGGYSCRLFNSNFGFLELDAIGGYRFNEYLHVGAGLGARYYFDNNKARYTTSKWAGPIFLDVRGQFIPSLHRNVVPYYSFDIGGTIRDGFMIRPTLGLRIGENRSAFLVGIAYTGQDMTTPWYREGERVKRGRFVSFVNLKIGYQF